MEGIHGIDVSWIHTHNKGEFPEKAGIADSVAAEMTSFMVATTKNEIHGKKYGDIHLLTYWDS